MRWYVVQAYSGFEQQVRRLLLDRINRENLSERFGQVLVPTEEVVEMRDGQKRKSDRKFFLAMCWCRWIWITKPGTWSVRRPRCWASLAEPVDKPAPISEKKPRPFCNGSKMGSTT